MKYIDILLTESGLFCVAPPWTIHEGDLVSLPNILTDKNEVHEVVSVVTDSVDGEFLNMMKRYLGGCLPKVTQRYKLCELVWEEENDV